MGIYAELAIPGFDHDKNTKRYRSPYPALCFFSWKDLLSVACCFRHFLTEQQLITTLRMCSYFQVFEAACSMLSKRSLHISLYLFINYALSDPHDSFTVSVLQTADAC